MKFSKGMMLFLVAALALFVTARTFAVDEEGIAKAPDAVQATVKKLLGDKIAAGFSPGDVPGKTVFFLYYDEKYIDHTAIISDDGIVIEEDTEISGDKLPAVVLNAIRKACPDGIIFETMTGTAGDKSFYMTELMVKQDVRVIKIDPGGVILSDSIKFTGIDPDKLPAVISDAFKKAHPDGTIDLVNTLNGNGKLLYEATVKIGTDSRDVELNSDGSIYTDSISSTDIDTNKLPAAISAAVNKLGGHLEIDYASIIKINGESIYQIYAQIDKDEHTIKVTSDGKIVQDFVINE